MAIKKNNLFFNNTFSICYSPLNSRFFFKGPGGIIVLKLPSYYFVKDSYNFFSFLFLNKFYFFSFFKHIRYIYRDLFKFNFVRLRLKGLGFKIRKITKNLYRFYFDYINFFYFHIPNNFIISVRRKRILFVAMEYSLLKRVLIHVLLLKKLSVYRIRGLVYPRQIIFLKIGKKNI